MADDPTAPEGQDPASAPVDPTPAQQAPQTVPARDPAGRFAGEPSQSPPDPATQPAPTRPEGQDPTDDAWDPERARRTIQQLRQTEKQFKETSKRLAEYEEADRKRQEADLTERERLQRELDRQKAELTHERQQYRDRTNEYEVRLQANRLGIVDPDAAVKLLDWASLDYDDDGKPVDLEAALDDLIKGKPYLKAPSAPAAPTAPAPHTQVSPTNAPSHTATAHPRRYSRAEVGNRAFYLANRDDIIQAMREGRID